MIAQPIFEPFGIGDGCLSKARQDADFGTMPLGSPSCQARHKASRNHDGELLCDLFDERRSATGDHPGGMRERACFEKALRGKQRPRLLPGLMVETRGRRPYTISAISSAKAPNSRAGASAVSTEDRVKVS